MMEPEHTGRWLSWLIVVASLLALAVMFVNRANPPERETVENRR